MTRAAIEKRLGELERLNQDVEKYAVVYELQGKYTRDGQLITAAQLAELEKTHQVILVSYVEQWRG